MISKNVRKGNQILIILVTSGDTCGDPKIRELESQKAAKILGVKNVKFIREKEGFSPISKKLKAIKSMVEKFKPDEIYLPHENEKDENHKNTFKAIKLLLSNYSAKFYGYEIWTAIRRPTLYIKIDDEIEKKKAALKEYGSQLKKIDYIDLALSLNRYRGLTSNKGKFCEAFEEINWLK